jgi:DNA-binding GntR family transcriptional regulator
MATMTSPAREKSTTVPAASIKQRIVDDLTEEIRTGRLKPGDKLPTTPQLQEAYGAQSVVPVRAAMALLKDRSLVEFVPGLGVFVVEPPAS